jgi:hypothetical protein
MRQRFDDSINIILAYEIHHIVKIFIKYNDCCHMLCLYLYYVPNFNIIVSFYAMYKSPAFLLPLSCCIQIYFSLSPVFQYLYCSRYVHHQRGGGVVVKNYIQGFRLILSRSSTRSLHCWNIKERYSSETVFPFLRDYLKLYFRHEIPPYISLLINLFLFLYHSHLIYNPLTVLIWMIQKHKPKKKNNY